ALNQLVDLNHTASFIRRNEASRLMNFGDKEPSHLPSLNALRVLKSKSIKKEQEHDDSILSLSILKNDIPYSTIIRDIGYDRFFVHYWSTVQMNAYRKYAKQSKTPLISIDATGGLVRKPSISRSSYAHMLSERHDNNSISHWLMQWTRDGAPSPKIVVTDQSIALMSACVRSFTQYSNLTTYLEVCYSLVLTPGKANKCDVAKTYLKNRIANDEFMLDDIIQENYPENIDKHVETIEDEIPNHCHSGYKSQMFKVDIKLILSPSPRDTDATAKLSQVRSFLDITVNAGLNITIAAP
ncbi:Uncharacterized protein FWK35_00028412, partial [Aphis craccivora]